MGQKQMVSDEVFFKAVRVIADKIIKENGDMRLFALVPDHNNVGTMEFFVSAEWLNMLSQKQGIERISSYFFEEPSEEIIRRISKIILIHTKDQNTVFHITKIFSVSHSIAEIKNCIIGNVKVERIILLESNQ